ncbi:hypothetical protein SCHPADRAFT_900482 [Schizopora paradoxa]|uniref:Uncharacterized protein n=1 Tax=Schizopora paradoxa TaxID=27342 RepID=A0A0H2S0N7_9AGAM|nr:hypothetical protein SCHPADRAFT_900482 [Schizopora paradoxa]
MASRNDIQLNAETVADCSKASKKEGAFAGLTSGLLGGLIGNRFLRFTRNQTILCGILTSVASGYLFTQAFLGSRLAEAKLQQDLLARRNSPPSPPTDGFSPKP